jgi:hypothetical protein
MKPDASQVYVFVIPISHILTPRHAIHWADDNGVAKERSRKRNRNEKDCHAHSQ